MLVAMNPFAWLELYSPADAKRYMHVSRLDARRAATGLKLDGIGFCPSGVSRLSDSDPTERAFNRTRSV